MYLSASDTTTVVIPSEEACHLRAAIRERKTIFAAKIDEIIGLMPLVGSCKA